MDIHDPLNSSAQEDFESNKKLKEQLDTQNEEADVKWLMSSKRGRRIVWRLLNQSRVFQLSFSPDALSMAFAEGNRSFGNRMLAMIHTLCPEQYPTMVKEQQNV